MKVLGRFHCQEALESETPFVAYRARTQGLAGFERVFALKTLPADAQPTRPDATQRLLEIASRATSIRDPRIGQVVDSGTAPNGTAYVATEFLFGVNLSVLRGGLVWEANAQKSIPTMLLAHVAAEIAAALAAAHEASPPLVHAGLTPSNVFVTIRGAVKVVDFGHRVAVLPSRLAGGKRFLSAYAAPELLLAGEGSPEADVFALASVLFELATGKTPPSARNPRSATDLSRALSVLPPDLAEVFAALLRADPAKRPRAREAEAMFRQVASGLSETELRAHLGALARRLSLPQTAAVQAQDSAVMPSLAAVALVVPAAPASASPPPVAMPKNKAANEPSAPPPPVVAPAPTAPTKRERRPLAPKPSFPLARAQRAASAAPPKPVEPQHTLPFSSLFDGLLTGATPQGINNTAPTAEIPVFPGDVAASVADAAPEAPTSTEGSEMYELSMTDIESMSAPDGEPTVSGNSYDAVRPRLTAALEAGSPAPLPPRPPKLPPLPVAGENPAPARPNMANLTTGELEAMFAPGLAEATSPPVAVAASSGGDDDDFLDDAETNAFDRRKIGHLLSDAKTPVRPPLATEQIFPAEAEAEVNASAAVLPWNVNGIDAPAEVDSAKHDAESPVASLHEQDNLAELDELPAMSSPSRRSLLITLATAAVVALVAGIAGDMLMGKSSPLQVRADVQGVPVPAQQMPVAQEAVAPDPVPAKPPAREEISAPVTAQDVAASATGAGGLAPRDAKGRLVVKMQTNPPGALIWINGGERGRTPATMELKDRHRTMVLVLAGYRRHEEELDHSNLAAEQTWTLQPANPPAPGSATIKVECEKADQYPIAVDGVETGLLCPATIALAPGEHEVSVLVPWRFKSYANRVMVSEGKTKTVVFSK